MGIKAPAPCGGGDASWRAVGGAEAVPAEEKQNLMVILDGFGRKEDQVIKVVRELTGLGLKESQRPCRRCPQAS